MSQPSLRFCLALVGAVLLVGVACRPREEAPEPEVATEEMEVEPLPAPAPMVAVATLQSRADTTATGTVSFTEADGMVQIIADIQGATPGTHGLHVHETGDCSAPDFTSAGGHFNPTGVDHGCPDSEVHHAGDLGNIEIGEDGTGHLEVTSDMLTVAPGPDSVQERAVIFHEGADDCVSQPTGAAGGRAACGLAYLAESEFAGGGAEEEVGAEEGYGAPEEGEEGAQ